MKEIPLTQGKVALVDDADYEELAKYKWCAHYQGKGCYAVRKNGNQIERMHRTILKPDAMMDVDHINGHGLDNRRCNLRACSRSENLANIRNTRMHTSRFKGVSWSKVAQRWQAQIGKEGQHYHLGYFDTEEEAARAYDAKARNLFDKFAYTNFA